MAPSFAKSILPRVFPRLLPFLTPAAPWTACRIATRASTVPRTAVGFRLKNSDTQIWQRKGECAAGASLDSRDARLDDVQANVIVGVCVRCSQYGQVGGSTISQTIERDGHRDIAGAVVYSSFQDVRASLAATAINPVDWPKSTGSRKRLADAGAGQERNITYYAISLFTNAKYQLIHRGWLTVHRGRMLAGVVVEEVELGYEVVWVGVLVVVSKRGTWEWLIAHGRADDRDVQVSCVEGVVEGGKPVS